jgi:glycosyltransferase involved in cell wall biosynthesis
MLLSGHIIIRNAVRYDYPFREAVRSALPVLDELVILCEPTGDGTEEWCEEIAAEFGRERTVVRYAQWWYPQRGKQTLADATNWCISRCRGEYHLQMQADDVFHEDAILRLRQAVEAGTADYLSFGIRNLWTGFETEWVGEHLCTEARWCARRSLYPAFRSLDDAFCLGARDGSDLALTGQRLNGQVDLINYGLVRRPIAFVRKSLDMARLYGLSAEACYSEAQRSIESACGDGRIDWTRLSIYDLRGFRPFTGQHPAVMREWIAARREEVDGWLVRE